MKRIALSSNGPLSGKTTLARYLHEHYGYVWANHSQTLVELYVEEFNKTAKNGLTVEAVLENKEYWRPSLQDFGNRWGFNTRYDAARGYMEYTLEKVGALYTDQPVVYEPFRGELQAKVLRDLGFFLVQIEIGEYIREQRAEDDGIDYNLVKASMQRAPELEGGIANPDLRLDGELATVQMARILVNLTDPKTLEV